MSYFDFISGRVSKSLKCVPCAKLVTMDVSSHVDILDSFGDGVVELPGLTDDIVKQNTKEEEIINDIGGPGTPVFVDRALTPSYSASGASGYECLQWTIDFYKDRYTGRSHNIVDYPNITAEEWLQLEWDGVTTWNPCILTKEEVFAGVCPLGGSVQGRMRGIKQLYDSIQPFADEYNHIVV